MLDIICEAICLSHATIITAETCVNQYRNKAKEMESFRSAKDDSNNISNTAQLLEVIWDITQSFWGDRKTTQSVSLHGQQQRKSAYACKKTCQNLSYSVWKLNGKKEEVQSMIVKKTGLISEKRTNWIPNFTWNLTTPSTNSHSMKRFSSLNMLQSAVHFIWPHGINFHQLQSFWRKLMLNMGISCTIYIPEGQVVGQCWKIF